jgi:hypothetical protein
MGGRLRERAPSRDKLLGTSPSRLELVPLAVRNQPGEEEFESPHRSQSRSPLGGSTTPPARRANKLAPISQCKETDKRNLPYNSFLQEPPTKRGDWSWDSFPPM